MRTPAGKECKFYFEDHYRGRDTQACRLLERNPKAGKWKPDHCRTCPVPELLRQNACPNLVMEGRIEKALLGLREQVKVYAICTSSLKEVPDPAVGCGECHLHKPGLNILR